MLFCAKRAWVPQKSNAPFYAIQGWKANCLRWQNRKYDLFGVKYLAIKLTVAMNRNVPIADRQCVKFAI